MLRFPRTLKRSASCYLTCASCVTGRVRYRRLRRLVASLAVPLKSSRIFSMAVAQHTILTASALACMRFRPRTRYLLSGSSVDKTERQVITRFVEREEGYAAGPGPVAYHHRHIKLPPPYTTCTGECWELGRSVAPRHSDGNDRHQAAPQLNSVDRGR